MNNPPLPRKSFVSYDNMPDTLHTLPVEVEEQETLKLINSRAVSINVKMQSEMLNAVLTLIINNKNPYLMVIAIAYIIRFPLDNLIGGNATARRIAQHLNIPKSTFLYHVNKIRKQYRLRTK